MKKPFAPQIVLVDTGERRLPHDGEVYCWRNRAGDIQGPFTADDADSWIMPAENFAIYKEKKA